MAALTLGAGDLRDRVRFERRRPGQGDGAGNFDGGWDVLIASRRVRLLPTRGGEQVIAARLQGTSNWDLWVRWDRATAGVVADDRVVDCRDETRIFNIKFVADLEGRRAWLLMQLEQGSAV